MTQERKRRYTLKQRAKAQEETRLRIVEATMALHQEVGPRATTISGIAERAGVQRLTVYRHFEDEAAVFQACTSHWLGLNPPPGPEDWAGIEDPAERRAAALRAFFDYYEGTRRMWGTAHRDVADVPALQGPMAQFAGYLDGVAEQLGDDLPRAARVTLRHLLHFPTWEALDAQGLRRAELVALGRAWIAGAAASG
jgi:AcrR family transcriptional regulator